MRLIDLSGLRFGRLRVLEKRTKGNKVAWLVKCNCGSEKIVAATDLRSGRTTSCGCFQREVSRKANTSHGRTKTPEYRVWAEIVQRCTNANHPRYADYGGRGIRVCKRWLAFDRFFADMGERPSPSHSIDRKDNNGNYEPRNCRWATDEEQRNNTRRNVILDHRGRAMSIAQWSRETQIAEGTIRMRLNRGWPVERALASQP